MRCQIASCTQRAVNGWLCEEHNPLNVPPPGKKSYQKMRPKYRPYGGKRTALSGRVIVAYDMWSVNY